MYESVVEDGHVDLRFEKETTTATLTMHYSLGLGRDVQTAHRCSVPPSLFPMTLSNTLLIWELRLFRSARRLLTSTNGHAFFTRHGVSSKRSASLSSLILSGFVSLLHVRLLVMNRDKMGAINIGTNFVVTQDQPPVRSMTDEDMAGFPQGVSAHGMRMNDSSHEAVLRTN
jgi:hypothetical protein